MTDPPWNQLAKNKSRLNKRKKGGKGAQPIGSVRLDDTDHLSHVDIPVHIALWYRILSDDGMVCLRLSHKNVKPWVDGLVAGHFQVTAVPHGIQEVQLLGQVQLKSHFVQVSIICACL